MRKQKRGFTIIELLTVIVIIGIILGMSIPAFNKRGAKYRSNRQNLIDELNVTKQKAVTTGSPVGFLLINDGFVADNDTFTLYEGISITSSDVSSTDTLYFFGNGTTSSSAIMEISGYGYSDTVVVTLTGYILAQD